MAQISPPQVGALIGLGSMLTALGVVAVTKEPSLGALCITMAIFFIGMLSTRRARLRIIARLIELLRHINR